MFDSERVRFVLTVAVLPHNVATAPRLGSVPCQGCLADHLGNSLGKIVGDAQVFAEEAHTPGDLLAYELLPAASGHRSRNVQPRSTQYSGELALGFTALLETLHLSVQRDKVRDAVGGAIAGAVDL